MGITRSFLLLFLYIIPAVGVSQNVTLSVLINPSPSPYFSQWKTNPAALGSLVISNPAGSRDVKIRASLRLQGTGVVLKCVTGKLRVGLMTTLTADKFLQFDDVSYPDDGFRNIVVQSGRLPEGSYNLCLTLEDLNGTALSTNSCGNFSIVYPNQPQLIAPLNNSNQSMPVLTFQWTPVLAPGAFTIHYVLKIAELLPSQTPNQALASNYPFYLNQNLQSNYYLYQNSGQPFQSGKQYAWQVQVLDQFGLAPAANQGKSEIFVFTYKPAQQVQTIIPSIDSPANNSSVTTSKPEIKWSYVLHNASVRYKVTIAPMNAYETADYAWQHNASIISKLMVGSTNFTPAVDLSMVNNKNYALRVQVVTTDGSVIASSAVIGFKFLQSAPVLVSPVNNGVIYHYKHEFKWSDASFSTSVKYKLRIVERKTGQGIIDAMASNTPVYAKTVAGMLSVTPDVNIPFKANQKYLYEVRALDNSDQVIGASSISIFSFDPVEEQTSTVTGTLYYEFADMGEYILTPMKNVLTKLVVRHMLRVKSKTIVASGHATTTASSGDIDISENTNFSFPNNNKVLGWCSTGSEGGFYFTFNNKDSLGQLVQKNVKSGQVLGEFQDYVTGDVYKVGRIMLAAPTDYYYASPSAQISVNPGKSATVSQAICAVRSYKTVFTIQAQPNNQNQATQLAISDMDVYLLRKVRPSLVPADEGKPRPAVPATMQGYEIIAQGKSSHNSTDRGQVVFTRMVRNQANNDEYYIYGKSDPEVGTLNYETPKVPVSFTFPNDKAVFSDQYVYPTVYKNIYSVPQLPSIWGVVQRTDGGALMKDAKVYIYTNPDDPIVESMHVTGADGYFPIFKNLPVTLSAGTIVGPTRDIVVGKPGYQTFKKRIAGKGQNEAMMLGEKSFQVVDIKPGMMVKGSVVDETGSGVNADVKIGDGYPIRALTTGYYPDPNHWNPAEFSGPAEVNTNVLITISPDNPAYFPEQQTVSTMGWNAPKQFTVYRKLHRVVIDVCERTNDEFPPPINGAKVKIKVGNVYLQQIAAANSNVVEFSFENDATMFSVEAYPPEGKYYEPVKTSIYNSAAKGKSFYSIGLKKAAFISGKVVVGTDKTPVVSAHVFIEQGGSTIDAYTGANGAFLLKNVPVNVPLTIWAVKHSTNTTYIGDNMKLTVPPAGKSNLEFKLTTYDGIDITNLFGFPIEVNSLSDKNGKIMIKGRFIDIPKNGQFALFDQTTSLGFDSVFIKPSAAIKNANGVPIAEPVNQLVQTNKNTLAIKVYNSFSATISDTKIGVHLVNAGTGKGVIKGEVTVGADAFNTGGKVSPLTFSLWNPALAINAQTIKIPVLTPDGTEPIPAPNGLRALSHTGSSIALTVNGFTTKVDSLNSYLKGDSLKLGAKLLCSVPGFSTANQQVDIGTLVIHPTGVDAITSKQPLTIPLESATGDWSINAQEWSFVNDLVISKGTVKAGKINVPIKTLTIKQNSLANKQFDLTSLMIAKKIPLHITGNVVFDYNASEHWFVYLASGMGSYSSYFTDLPGTEDTAKVYLTSLKSTSTGKMHIAPWSTQPPIKIHSVTSLQPDIVDLYDDAISISGLRFDPVIPDYSGTSSVSFETSTGTTKLICMPFNIPIVTKGMQLKFGVTPEEANSQVLNEDGFKSYGTIGDPPNFTLKSWLYHTKDSTSVMVETPVSPDKKSTAWQKMDIGGGKTSLEKVDGRMAVVNGKWEAFNFNGDLTGTEGVTDENRRLAFTADGKVEAKDQAISLVNVPQPFGGMKITYDFPNHRLVGSLKIDQNMNGLILYATANMVVDPDGWYMFAGGTTTIPGGATAKMAMLFGSYPRIEQTVKDEFAKTSYKQSLPPTFDTQIKGFLLSGSAAYPILVPSVNLPLGVVNIDIGHNEGLDTRIWCGFDEGSTTYGVGNIGFVHLWAVLQSLTCTEMGGDIVVDVGYTGTYTVKTYQLAVDACQSISLKAWLKQRTPFVDFDGPTCIDPTLVDIAKDYEFKATIHMDSGGGSNFKVEKGTCHD